MMALKMNDYDEEDTNMNKINKKKSLVTASAIICVLPKKLHRHVRDCIQTVVKR